MVKKEHLDHSLALMMERFDKLENLIREELAHQTKIDGETLLDNQDVCHLLKVSKRTLQRYRSTGDLRYQRIYQKTYYKESDVENFILNQFNKRSREIDDK